jgi:transposase
MSGKMMKTSRAAGATRRRHTEEFRREALLLAARTGVASAATELGIQPSLLYGWQGKARAAREGAQVEQAQSAEIARLKRQLAEQSEELAILKKAAAYFARASK